MKHRGLRNALGINVVAKLRSDEKEEFYKWITNPDLVAEKEMGAFIEKIKEEEEKSFIVTWKPEDQNWLTEEEMAEKKKSAFPSLSADDEDEFMKNYTTPKFVTNMNTDDVEQSMRDFQRREFKDINEDLKEIGQKRFQLFKQIAELHKKENLLVARQRALRLEKCIFDETL